MRFVLDKVVQAVDKELSDDTVLREELLAAQMRRELGEISEDEFAAIERDILAAIREIRRPSQGVLTMSSQDKITGVEIETFDSDRET